MTTEMLLNFGTPIITPIAVALVKTITDKIPAKWLPCVSMLIGALADALAALTTGHQFSPERGALLGLAGVGVREVLDQLKPKVTAEQVKLMAAGLFLFAFTGCASAVYDRTVTTTDPTTKVTVTERTKGHMRSQLSTSSMKGFVLGKETKTSKSGISIQEANTDPNVEFMKAMGEMLSGAVSAAASGAVKGATHP